MPSDAQAQKYFGIACILIGGLLCVILAIVEHLERMQ